MIALNLNPKPNNEQKITPSLEHLTQVEQTLGKVRSRLFGQFFRYTIVGGIAAVFDLATFAFLVQWLAVNYLVSTSVSFVAGAVVNFLLCLLFVFRLHGHSWQGALWRKLLSALAALGVNLAVMYLAVDVLAFDQIEVFGSLDGLVLARCVAIGVSFFLNFILTKYYAFRDF